MKQENRRGVKFIDVEDAIQNLYCLMPETESIELLGSGGVLVFTLLSRLGYSPKFNTIGAERRYTNSGIEYIISGDYLGGSLLDDIVSGGGVVNAVISKFGITSPDVFVALISANSSRGRFRERSSGVQNVRNVYAGTSVNSNDGGPPAIFSTRFILMKLKKDPRYRKYFSKYTGNRMDEFMNGVGFVDTSIFELLYSDPSQFMKKYGGKP